MTFASLAPSLLRYEFQPHDADVLASLILLSTTAGFFAELPSRKARGERLFSRPPPLRPSSVPVDVRFVQAGRALVPKPVPVGTFLVSQGHRAITLKPRALSAFFFQTNEFSAKRSYLRHQKSSR